MRPRKPSDGRKSPPQVTVDRLDPLELRIRDEIRQSEWGIDDGAPVVASVSGGLDSMALLSVLVRLAERGGPPVAVVHVDHMLRGEESRRDALFVGEACSAAGVAFHPFRINVALRARHRGVGVEEEGRRARHEAWRRVTREANAAAVATGHHADDQVETFLFRLMRGSGSRGLGAMRAVTEIDDIRVVRPFLRVRRRELSDYAERRGLVWREDATNASLDPVRNRIRHRLLRVFDEVAPGDARGAIARAAAILAEEDAWLDSRASELLGAAVTGDGLDTGVLREAHAVPRRRALRLWLARVTGGTPSRAAVERIDALVHSRKRGTRRADLEGGIEVEVCYGLLRVAGDETPPFATRRLRLPGMVTVRELGLRIVCREVDPAKWRDAVDRAGGPGDAEAIDLDAVGPDAVVRAARPGDRIRPLGMRGARKLHDLFTDLRIPREQRWRWPVVEAKDGIVWVVGLRLGESFRIRPATARAAVLRRVNTAEKRG